MLDLLVNVAGQHDRGVLLPGYIGWSPREGSGVFDTITSLGLDFCFYNLQDDLRVNLVDLEKQIRPVKYRIIVVIHCFGRAERHVKHIRQLADELEMVLIEDLAHGILTVAVGCTGDLWGNASLYSLHMRLPVSQRGVARLWDDSLVASQVSTKPGLAATKLDYDWDAVANRRRSNFRLLVDRLVDLKSYGEKFKLLWPGLDCYDVPQTLPIVIVGSGRDGLYPTMNAQGVGMVSPHHALIRDIPESAQNIRSPSRHTINFPVHQDVTIDDVAQVVDVLAGAMELP